MPYEFARTVKVNINHAPTFSHISPGALITSEVACVAGVNGKGKRKRKRGRKMGVWGQGTRERPAVETLIFFISAAAKF